MGDIKEIRSLVDKAHREEIKASNEMHSDEHKAMRQKEQLDTCLNYRNECLNGLKTAQTSGLSVAQIRECKLLVEYLDSVVETKQYQADISAENYEESKIVWQKKHEHFINLKESLQQLKASESDLAEQEQQVRGNPLVNNKTYRTYETNKKYK